MDVLGAGSMELPDLLIGMPSEEEFVPVDNFFSSYVSELAAGSKRAHEQVGDYAGGSKAAKVASGQTAGMPGPGLSQPQAGLAGGMQPPYMLGGQQGLPLMPGMPVMNGGMPAMPAMGGGAQGSLSLPLGLMGMPGMPGGLPGSLPGGPNHYMGAAADGGNGGLPNLDLSYLDPAAGGSGGGYCGGGGIGADVSGTLSGGDEHHSGGQRKSVKQQEANKVAQQRYRERKKQKFHEMEATIDQLSKQLQALQALQSRNSILEGLNGELQCQLMTREKEVEKLKVALDTAAERSLGSHPSSPSDGGTDASPLECAEDGCVSCDVLPRDLAGIDFKKGFSDQVERLRAFLQQHGIADKDPPEGILSRQLNNELAQLVGRSCQLCQAALRAEGVKVMELISKDPHSFAAVGSTAEQQRWEACLRAMQLTGEQGEHLLLSRTAHLQRMRVIYQERHNLNMQAMGLMLPHSSRNPSEDNTVEGRLASMSQGGYLPVAKSSAELSDVLDKIKDNLRQEQRCVMDLNCLLMSKILTPLQGARYMLGAYPQHCDALALSNVLAKSMGREALSEGVPPASGGAAQASTGGCRAQGCC